MISFETIQTIIAQVTGRHGVERHDILSDVTADSLERMQIAVEVECALDIHITDAELERLETVGDLHNLVNRKKGLTDAKSEEREASAEARGSADAGS